LNFGDMIRKRREDLGLTQLEVARKARIHHTTVARIEQQNRLPSILVAARLAEALGLNENEIVQAVLKEKKQQQDTLEAKRLVLNSPLTAEEIEMLLKAARKKGGSSDV
jgi:transcriptional regulator with XRE-family HTH domain